MKRAQLRSGESNEITAEQVQEYLSDHPDFFTEREELLEVLVIPHDSGSAVSLVEKQLQIYREKNEKLDQQLSSLLQIARDNDDLFRKMHSLTLALMDADDLESAIAGLQSTLHDQFKADFVSLRIIRDVQGSPIADVFVSPGSEKLQSLRKIIDSGRPKCGVPKADQAEFLFGSNAGNVKSCSMIPFTTPDGAGILGIGSTDSERFLPTMGHLFLSRIGEMIGFRLGGMLDAGG